MRVQVKLLKRYINGRNYASLIYSEIKGEPEFYALSATVIFLRILGAIKSTVVNHRARHVNDENYAMLIYPTG